MEAEGTPGHLSPPYDMRDLRVAALTGGANDPSSRFRVRQYMPALRSLGIIVKDYPASVGRYPPMRRAARYLWGMQRLREAARQALVSRYADVTLIQREMLSTVMTFEAVTRRPRVFDVDDAIWLTSRFGAVDRIASKCDVVICGNKYLADHFGHVALHVEVIPTGVDTARWMPDPPKAAVPRIGWTGSSSNLRHLENILPTLRTVLREVPGARFAVMCDRCPSWLSQLPGDQVEYWQWSPEQEVSFVQGLTVGLMPLSDGTWERGKCAFKMLLYLACGIPAIVSPVGASVQVLEQGRGNAVGIAASTDQQWTDAMVAVLTDSIMGNELGSNGRELVERVYSIRAVVPQLAAVLRGLGRG